MQALEGAYAMGKTILEAEKHEDGYVAAVFGGDYDFVERKAQTLPEALRMVADDLDSGEGIGIVDSNDDGVTVSFRATATLPWETIAKSAISNND